MARGCHLGIRSLIVVLRDKTLLVFPLIPFTCVIAIATVLWWFVGNDQVLWALIVSHMMSVKNALIAYTLYLAFGLVSVFFGVGLVTCTRITLEERDSKFLDGFRHAVRNLHWITIWAFISWTVGPILNLLDHQRLTTLWVRKLLKTSWSVVSYFVIPILVVDKVNVFSALRRSVDVMSHTWGKGAISKLGLYWFFLFLNIPTLVMFAMGHYPEGPWPNSLTLVLLLYIYATIVVYQTANSVLSVVLYKYAADGTVVPGFKEEHLKLAFIQPKLYVLRTEDPGEDFEQVVEASTEEVPVAGPPARDTVETTEEAVVHDAPEASLAEDSEVTPADNEDSEAKPS
jgi:hypothetical protein